MYTKKIITVSFLALIIACTSACEKSGEQTNNEDIPLKEAFEEHFFFGTALNPSHHYAENKNETEKAIVEKHFSAITAENAMKWESIHPEPDSYFFEVADSFVEFGEQNDMHIVGHTLVWHSQTPRWVFQDENGDPVSREVLLERMRDHIHTVVGRYKGRVDAWDVVNEAVADDGSWRKSPWYNIIGEDYVAKAFEYAREADPDAELYYNDYSLANPEKREGALKLVKSLQEKGIEVSGIGMQGHYGLDYPELENLEESIIKFGELAKVAITELDIDVLPSAFQYQGADINRRAELADSLNPYTEGLPDSMVQKQTKRFEDFFRIFLKHDDVVDRVTLWGVTDASSWKNHWPVPGRTNYPLLFSREGQPKPAVKAIIELTEK